MSSQTVYFNNPADITKLQGQVGTVAGQVNSSVINTTSIIASTGYFTNLVTNGQATIKDIDGYTTQRLKSVLNIEPTWFKDCIIYQIYPQSYQATTGTYGYGSFKGIRQRLDYIQSLGVNAVWFNPFWTSPLYDAGYDVSDYGNVDPRWGTTQDALDLFADMKDRGLKVIGDYVANHCSFLHPYFTGSRSSKTNEYADYFTWSDGRKDESNNRLYALATRRIEQDGDYSKKMYDHFWRGLTNSSNDSIVVFRKNNDGSFTEVQPYLNNYNEHGVFLFQKRATYGITVSASSTSSPNVFSVTSTSLTGCLSSTYQLGQIVSTGSAFLVPAPVHDSPSALNFEPEVWTYVPDRDQLFFHCFYAYQPDWKFSNPNVVEFHKSVLRRYFEYYDLDGLRIDAFVTSSYEQGNPDVPGAVQVQPDAGILSNPLVIEANSKLLITIEEIVRSYSGKGVVLEDFGTVNFGLLPLIVPDKSLISLSNANLYANMNLSDMKYEFGLLNAQFISGKKSFKSYIELYEQFINKLNKSNFVYASGNHDLGNCMKWVNGPSKEDPTPFLTGLGLVSLNTSNYDFGFRTSSEQIANLPAFYKSEFALRNLAHGSFGFYYGDEIGANFTNVYDNTGSIQIDLRGNTGSLRQIWNATHTRPDIKHDLGLIGGRDNARTPMKWDSSIFGGFIPESIIASNNTGATGTGFYDAKVLPWLPVNPDYTTVNVAAQESDPSSILNFVRRLNGLRKVTKIFGVGDLRYCYAYESDPNVQGFTRSYGDEKVLILYNGDSEGFLYNPDFMMTPEKYALYGATGPNDPAMIPYTYPNAFGYNVYNKDNRVAPSDSHVVSIKNVCRNGAKVLLNSVGDGTGSPAEGSTVTNSVTMSKYQLLVLQVL
jgi:glycosidase